MYSLFCVFHCHLFCFAGVLFLFLCMRIHSPHPNPLTIGCLPAPPRIVFYSLLFMLLSFLYCFVHPCLLSSSMCKHSAHATVGSASAFSKTARLQSELATIRGSAEEIYRYVCRAREICYLLFAICYFLLSFLLFFSQPCAFFLPVSYPLFSLAFARIVLRGSISDSSTLSLPPIFSHPPPHTHSSTHPPTHPSTHPLTHTPRTLTTTSPMLARKTEADRIQHVLGVLHKFKFLLTLPGVILQATQANQVRAEKERGREREVVTVTDTDKR